MTGRLLINIILLIISIGLAAGGQLVMKAGMVDVGEITGERAKNPVALAKDVLSSYLVIVGVLMYAVSAVFWLIVLSRLPLSVVYPMVAAGYVIVVFLSTKLFDETVKWFGWLGLFLIVAGVVITGFGLRTPK